MVLTIYCLRKKHSKNNGGHEIQLGISNNLMKVSEDEDNDGNYEVPVKEFSRLSKNPCEDFISPTDQNNVYSENAQDASLNYKSLERQAADEYLKLTSLQRSPISKSSPVYRTALKLHMLSLIHI